MATKKREDLLSFDRGKNWVSPAELRRKEEEKEKLRLEEERRLKPDFSDVRGSPSLDKIPTKDDGYSIWDVGVSARQGAAAVTKGALGLPVNAANLVAAPFMGTPFQQPELVRGMREIIDEQQQGYYDRQASDKLKTKNLEFQKADGVVASAKFAATNPGWMGLQAFQQGPQLLAAGPGGATAKVLTGALSAATQAEDATSKALREAGYSEEEIAERSSKAFAASLALNAVTPFANKSTFLEGFTRRMGASSNRVTDGVLRDVLSKTAAEVREGIITEVGDQYIQNLASNKPWDKGLAQAGVLGAYISAAVTGPAATFESAAEAGRAASKLHSYLKDQRFRKEAVNEFNVAPGGSGELTSGFIEMTQGPLGISETFNRDSTGTTPAEPVLDRELLTPAKSWAKLQGNPDPAFVKANQEAETLVANKQKSIEAAEKRRAKETAKKVKAADDKVADRIVTESMRLPAEDRSIYVRDQLELVRERKASAEAVVKPANPAAPITGATEDTPSIPVSTLTDTLDNAPAGSVSLPSVAPAQRTGATLEDIQKAVGGGKRDKLASRISYMVEDGNLDIVQDQSDIEGDIGQMEVQGAGWYDGKTGKTYLVAGNLDPQNVRGDILATLAHETKHSADFSGSEGLARSFKSFVGEEANLRMYQSIVKAAQAGDKSAQYALDQIESPEYTNLKLTDGQRGSEVVAHYISEESKKTGITTSLYRGIVSPLRAGARKLIRSNDVSLGDIHYMADKLVSEVAGRGERMSANPSGKALPMFAGVKAKTANLGNKMEAETRLNNGEDPEIIRRETGWAKGSEGKFRFEFSDDQAKLKPFFKLMQPGNKPMLLKDAIDHDKLFAAYPWIKLIRVTRIPGKDASVQGWAGKFEINVTPTAKGPESTLLHEIQHIIQEYEKFASGGSQNTVFSEMSPEQLAVEIPKVVARIEAKGRSAAESAEAFTAIAKIPKGNIKQIIQFMERERVLFNQVLKQEKKAGRDSPEYREAFTAWKAGDADLVERNAYVLGIVGLDPSKSVNKASLRMAVNGENPLEAAATFQSIAKKEWDKKAGIESGDKATVEAALKETDALFTFYKKLAGEVEARTTQLRQKMTDEQRVNESPVTTRMAEYDEVAPEEEIVIVRDDGSNSEQAQSALPSIARTADKDRRTRWEKKKDSSALVRAVDDVFSTTEGRGLDLFQLFDARQGLRGDLSVRAEAAGSRMEKGIRAAAKARGTTINNISKEIEKALVEINKMATKEAREAAVGALDTKYPGVGTSLNEIRNLKWSLARKIIEQRRDQGGDLTPKEVNIYGAIVENAETYTTRAYMSTQIPGKKFARRRLQDIKDNPKGEEATRYQEAIDFLINSYLKIPTLAEMEIMDDHEIKKFYQHHIGNPANKDMDTLVSELDAIDRKSVEEYNKQAQEIAEELMGFRKTRGQLARGYSGARQNRTILEGRESVPDEIRFLMGEVTNPLAAEMMSIARLVNLYTQTNMLQKMAKEGENRWYKNNNDGDFKTQLTDDSYGPMKGKWVTDSAAKFLKPAVTIGLDLEQALNTSAKDIGELGKILIQTGMAPFRMLTSGVKLVDLVTSPAAMLWNYVGAYAIVVQNGADTKYIGKAQRDTARAIKAHYKPTAYNAEEMGEIQELIRSRVLDSATVGEFQQSFYDSMFRFLEDEATEGGGNMMLKLGRALKDGTMTVKDVYAFMDMWAKVAAYYHRRDYLTKFYEANGDTVSREEIVREAGKDIVAANISYTRAFKGIKMLERNVPMFTMYLTYFSEVPRSLVFSGMLAVKDFKRARNAKTPEAKALANDAGFRRAAGTLSVTALVVAMVSRYLDGLGEQEERRRKTDPEWEQNGIPAPLGKTKDGKVTTMNILRADPDGPVNEFLIRMNRLEGDDDIGDALLETFKSQFVTAKPVGAVLRLVSGLLGNETKNNDEVSNSYLQSMDDLSWGDNTNNGRNLAAVLEGFTPRIIKGTYRTLKGTVGKRGYEFDAKENPAIAIAQSLGINPMVRDPEFSLEMSTSKYKGVKADAQKELKSIKERFGRLDADQLIKKLAPIVEDEEKAYRKLWEVYDGTKAFNGYYMDKDYVKAAKLILKNEKLGPAAGDIANGAFNVRFISREYINEWRDARIGKIKEMDNAADKSKAMASLRKEYKLVADYLGSQKQKAKE